MSPGRCKQLRSGFGFPYYRAPEHLAQLHAFAKTRLRVYPSDYRFPLWYPVLLLRWNPAEFCYPTHKAIVTGGNKLGCCVTIEDKAQQLKQLVTSGKTKGYVLYDEIDELVPTGDKGGPALDEILSQLARNGIEVLEKPRAEQEFGTDDESLDDNELQELSEQAGDAPVTMYLREVLVIPHLTQEQEIELAKRISGGGQDAEEAEKQLIEANLRLVVKIAKRYRNQGRGLLDLLQEGNIGLMQAVKQFNYTRGYKFSTCAIFWIRRTISPN